MDLLRTMVDHHVWLLGQMCDQAATPTDEQLDAPIEISVEGIDAEVGELCAQTRLDELIVCPGESVEAYTVGAMIAHVITFASYRRTLVAGALHDAGCDDLDSGDPMRWITQAS